MADKFELVLGGKAYLVRPTFEAIEMIEDKLGKSVLAVISDVQTIADLRIRTVVIVLQAVLLSAEEKLTEVEVGNLIVEGGYSTYMALTGKILRSMIQAGPAEPEELPEGEDKSAEEQED